MTQRIPSSARRRLRVGRTQKFSASAYRLRNVIEWENYIWIYILASYFVLQVIISIGLTNLSQEFNISPISTVNTVSSLIVAASLIGRIFYNAIVRELLKYGMNRDKHILNIVVSAVNGLIALPLFIVSAYATLFASITIISILEPLWKLLKELILPSGEAQPILLLSIAIIAGIYITMVLLTFFLFYNSVRSFTNLIHACILLPSQNKISSSLSIKNYHHTDNEKLEQIYLDSVNKEHPQVSFTTKDYEMFLRATDPRYIRVLLRNGEAIGFYSTSQKRDSVENMMIDKEFQGQQLHKEFLKDFEQIAYKKFTRTIRAHLPEKDMKTINFLTERGWTKEESKINGQVEMIKKISKNEQP